MSTRVTLSTIAEEVGLSTKTVSLALRADPAVSPETIRKVRETAGRLSYRRMREQTSTLGVVAPYVNHPFYSDFLQTIQDRAAREGMGYVLSFRFTEGNVAAELDALQDLDRARVDGLILLSPVAPAKRLETFIRPERPIVAINADLGVKLGLVSLGANNFEGAQRAVRHLLENGHRAIAYLADPMGSYNDQSRQRGYQTALRDKGCFDPRYVVQIRDRRQLSYATGYDACRQLLEVDGLRPTAILAYNDILAIGVIRKLGDDRSRGIPNRDVPKHISVVGFDDLDIADFTVPRLTTVSLPRKALATLAFETLIDLVATEGQVDGLTVTPLEPVLMVRESSGPAPGAAL